MGLKTWFRRTFIVPAAVRRVEQRLGFEKGALMKFIPGFKTYLAAILGMLTAVYGFMEGQLSVGELIQAIMIGLTAMGLSAKGNRIEEAVEESD